VNTPTIVPDFDPCDVDPALADAVARAPLELREIAMLESDALGEIMEYALLTP
jgi:hypothetical protein